MKKALEPFDSRAFDNQSTAHMRASDSSSSSIRTVTVGPGFHQINLAQQGSRASLCLFEAKHYRQ